MMQSKNFDLENIYYIGIVGKNNTQLLPSHSPLQFIRPQFIRCLSFILQV